MKFSKFQNLEIFQNFQNLKNPQKFSKILKPSSNFLKNPQKSSNFLKNPQTILKLPQKSSNVLKNPRIILKNPQSSSKIIHRRFHNLQRPRLRAAFAAKLSSWRSKLKAQGWSRGAAQHYAGLAMRPLSHSIVASRIAAL